MKTSDNDLLAAYLRNEDGIKRYFTRVTGSPSDAEDLAQEAWIKLARNSETAVAAPVPYLLRIVRSLSIDYNRKRRSPLNQAEIADILSVADDRPSHHQGLEDRDQIRHLARIVDELPERQRRILTASRLEKQRHADIAAALGVTVRTVEMDLRKALDYCAARLDRINRA